MRSQRTRSARGALALALFVALGCSASVDAGPLDPLDASITLDSLGTFITDSASYAATKQGEFYPGVPVYGFTVITRYVNPTPVPIYLATCYPKSRPPIYSVVSADAGSTERVAYNGAWACVGHDQPIRVEPGEVVVDTLKVRGPNAFDGTTHQPLATMVEGKFRIQFAAYGCSQEGSCPLATGAPQRSSAFTVRLGN